MRGGAVWQLVGLITRRSQVQILPPLPTVFDKKAPPGAFLLGVIQARDMSRQAIVARLEELTAPIVESFGLELWGIEYAPVGGSALLRVFIDSPRGVTLKDCAAVSDQLSAVLDVEDPIPEAYRLEVSSPGLDRVLFKPEQFRRYSGERVKVRLRWPVEGRRNLSGVLQDCSEEELQLEVEGGSLRIPLEAVHRARLMESGQLPARQNRLK